MYLKLGKVTICDSESDGYTKALSAPIAKLPKNLDSVQPKGSTNPTHFQRKGVSRTMEITVVRQFESYRAAEIWTVEHIAEMEKLSVGGDLEFESYLGVGYLYGSSALQDVEVVNAAGVSVEIKYTFTAGRSITFYGVTVVEESSGNEYLVVLGNPEICPTVRSATR